MAQSPVDKAFNKLGYRLQTVDAVQASETETARLTQELAEARERAQAESTRLQDELKAAVARAEALKARLAETSTAQSSRIGTLEAELAQTQGRENRLTETLAIHAHKIEALVSTRQQLKQVVERVREERFELAGQAKALGREVAVGVKILAQREGELAAARDELAAARKQIDEISTRGAAELGAAHGKIDELSARRQELKEQLRAHIEERNAAQAAAKAVEKELAAARAEQAASAKMLAQLQGRLEATHAKVEQVCAHRDQIRAQLQAEHAEFKAERRQAQTERDKALALAAKAQARTENDHARHKEELADARKQLTESRRRAEKAEELTNRLRADLLAVQGKVDAVIARRDDLKALVESARDQLTAADARHQRAQDALQAEQAAHGRTAVELRRVLSEHRRLLAELEAQGADVGALEARKKKLARDLAAVGDAQAALGLWCELGEEASPEAGVLNAALAQGLYGLASTDGYPAPDDVAGWLARLAALELGGTASPTLVRDPGPTDLARGGEVLDRLTLIAALRLAEAPAARRALEAAWQGAAAALADASDAPKAGQPDHLEHLLASAIAEASDPGRWRELALAASIAGRTELAAAASRRAVLLAPADPANHELRARLLAGQGFLGLAAAHVVAAVGYGGASPVTATSAIGDYLRAAARHGPARDLGLQALAEVLVERCGRERAVAAFVKGAHVSRNVAVCTARIELGLDGARAVAGKSRRRAAATSLPLVLISQVQRSGGTLLTQLLDGHPQLLVHPHELKIGHPNKWDWPSLDLERSPEELLAAIFEKSIPDFMVEGYAKADSNRFAAQEGRKPFDFSFETFCAVFLAQCAKVRTQRGVLDAYLNAYFAAWRGAEPSARSRWVAGFAPRLISYPESVKRLFEDYPDGRVLSCVREPVSWYVSSRRHSPEYAEPEAAMALWLRSTEAALELARARPDQVQLLTYEALVKDTETAMRAVAAGLGVDFDPILLKPTYMGGPILPNSSFDIGEHGVHAQSLDRRDQVTAEQLELIDKAAAPLYQQARRTIEGGGEAPAAKPARSGPARRAAAGA